MALRGLHEQGLRAHLAGQPAALRRVAERHQVRGGDHLDGGRHARRAREQPRRGPRGADLRLGLVGWHREHPAGDEVVSRPGEGGAGRARARAGGAHHRPRGLRQGGAVLPHQAQAGAGGAGLRGRREGDEGRGDEPHGGDGGLRAGLPLRAHRPGGRARRVREEAPHRVPRRRVPGRLHLAVGEAAGRARAPVRLQRPGRHLDVGRHAQVRLRGEGHLGGAVPRARAALVPVLHADRLARRAVHLAHARREPARRAERRCLGRDGVDGQGGLPRVDAEDHRRHRADEGRRARHPRAAADGGSGVHGGVPLAEPRRLPGAR